MVEADDKAKYVRVMGTEGETFISMEESEGSEPDDKEYDSDNDGDLFLYYMAQALDGVKEALPKVNFRRKHPQLGKKISNHEQRIRRIEKTIENLKNLLAPHLLNSMKKNAVDLIDKNKDSLIDNL